MRRKYLNQIDPDEIFLDSSNLPNFNVHHFEGRLEKPIRKLAFHLLFIFFLLVLTVFTAKVADLQLNKGVKFAERSANNTLRQIPIFAERGLIKDRNGVELAWNDQEGRHYLEKPGFSHLLGYISYPTEEELSASKYHPKELIGRAGTEKSLNSVLEGGRGIKVEEVDVKGELVSEHVLKEPSHGESVELSIDAGIQQKMFEAISGLIDEGKFIAGAGVMMDLRTGELIALTSVPEYDSNILSKGDDQEAISNFLNNKRLPFLNRAIKGLYTPGSVVKPVMALAALTEKTISPDKQIFSSGELRVPNPYAPGQYSVFKDWKALGWVDMRHGIAMSSDVYFYTLGGGFEGQKGIGISNIDKYTKLFGYGSTSGINLEGEEAGLVPTPEWKAKTFPDDPDWRLGNTYHTVIGQYGFQVTPLQVARAIGAVATDGHLLTPTILKQNSPSVPFTQILEVAPESYQIVREGMRLAVEEGTAMALSTPAVPVAGKTGTAELGVSKDYVNSWVTGFFPYEEPRYVFAIVMERGHRTNLIGAPAAMRQVLDWIAQNSPQYFAL